MRRPSGSGHMRRQAAPAGLGGPARGGRPCPKVPLRGGPLSTPQGCRACATREWAPGIFPKFKAYRTPRRGRGSSPSRHAGDGCKEPPGRPQREYSHRPTRGTAANPPSPPSRASPPPTRGTGSPLVPIGGGPPSAQKRGRERRRHPLESGPAARAGSGPEIGVRLPRFAGFRRPSGKRPLAEGSRLSRRRPPPSARGAAPRAASRKGNGGYL